MTGLTAASALDGTEVAPVDQSGTTKKATIAQIWTLTPNKQTGTSYSVADGDRAKLVTFTNAASIAVTLPQAGASSLFINGWYAFFENRGVGAVTITPTTSTVDGAATFVLLTNQGVLIASDGTNYFTSARSGPQTESIIIACSDETTALAAGAAKLTFRMPYSFTVTGIRASLTTAQTSGSIFTVDVNESGITIMSTLLTIDNTEKTSTTAATPPVISDPSIADDAEMTIDIDQIGDGTAKGLKVVLMGHR